MNRITPREFRNAFVAVMQAERESFRAALDYETKSYNFFMRTTIYPRVARHLGLLAWNKEYYTLDGMLYEERGVDNTGKYATYANWISVAIEHENDSSRAHEKMNKLQSFNAPLKVLITYAADGHASESLLRKYENLIRTSDVFNDVATLRQQLVILGTPKTVREWRFYAYENDGFVLMLPRLAAVEREDHRTMSKFVIQPHFRLQEWVADEKGYFAAEGLDYVFHEEVRATDGKVHDKGQKIGAYQSFESGRASDVSCACHWTVNVAASNGLGKLYPEAYSVAPAGIFVPGESAIRHPQDLAGVPISVGYQSGSHYSSVQAPGTVSAVGQDQSILQRRHALQAHAAADRRRNSGGCAVQWSVLLRGAAPDSPRSSTRRS